MEGYGKNICLFSDLMEVLFLTTRKTLTHIIEVSIRNKK